MTDRRTLDLSLAGLGQQLLDADDVKAVMMSKDDSGDVLITLVEGRDVSHKVRFGRVDRKSRRLVRHGPASWRSVPQVQGSPAR